MALVGRSLKTTFVAVLFACGIAHGQGQFETYPIEGWTIHLDRSIRARDPALASQAIQELQLRLQEISRLLPSKRVDELRRVDFYLHLEAESDKGGYAARKVAGDDRSAAPGSIDLGSVAQFLRSQHDVPSRVLHELAHGYHFQVLGADDPDINAAFNNASRTGRYTRVLNWQGKVVDRSYALTNAVEYFALATQAYYERSGFYPFDRAELRTYDPVAFDLIEKVWQIRPGPQPASAIRVSQFGKSCTTVTWERPFANFPPNFPAVLAIRNDSQTPVQAWWLSGRGEERKYADIAPGGLFLQRVFNPHIWQIRDQRNECLAALHVGELGSHVTLQP